MAGYATALEVWGPTIDITNMGSGGNRETMRGASTKHAVAHPGTDPIDLRALQTLCGKPTRNMSFLPKEQGILWTALKYEDGVCTKCLSEAKKRELRS